MSLYSVKSKRVQTSSIGWDNYVSTITSSLTELPSTSGILGYNSDTTKIFLVDGYFHIVFTESDSITISSAKTANLLLVAGGGGGGGWSGGGGGAGGVLNLSDIIISGNTYTITVGAGGSGTTSETYPDSGKSSGGNTSAFGYMAIGGGQGGQFDGWNQAMVNGGSGGGSAYAVSAGIGYNYPGPNQQGYPGSPFYNNYGGGGGGGSGQAGYNRNGGNGQIISWLTPSQYTSVTAGEIGQLIGGNTYIAGGGSAGSSAGYPAAGIAGLGGGGRGSVGPSPNGKAGNIYTGGGGGSAATLSPSGVSQIGATAGGSGIVVLRFLA